jgi:hypothetical protein
MDTGQHGFCLLEPEAMTTMEKQILYGTFGWTLGTIAMQFWHWGMS